MGGIEQLYEEGNKILEESYNKIFSEARYTIWDGVFSPQSYVANSFRVLFINREPYDEDEDGYNVVETIREQISRNEAFWKKQYNLKNNIRDQLAILALLKENNMNELTNELIEKQINRFRCSDSLFEDALLKSAYINIKKSDGNKRSSCRDLRECAQKGMRILKAQLAFLNPSVIVGGNVVDGILNELVEWGDNLYVESKYIKVFQLKVGDNLYPFIDAYHPSALSYGENHEIPMNNYYHDFVEALRYVAQHNEHYWENRRELPVFDMKRLKCNL